MIRRREFIILLGGAAALPVGARAQQPGGLRRIGIVHDYNELDPVGQGQVAAFREALEKLGWTDGRNAVLEYRSGATDNEMLRGYATEMLSHKPDVVLTSGATITATLQRATRSVPIIFVNVTDPVGAGLVTTLSRPGGNVTGFTQFEFGISAKWLELLKEMAPTIARVAVVRDPTARTGGGQLGAIQAVAPSLGVDVRPIDPHDPADIERALSAFSPDAKTGLIVTSSRLARVHRELIVTLAARYRLPAIYAFRAYVAAGGLMFYGPDATDPYRRAAGYVDRVLKGEKPQNLPVQAPTKYELVINLKAAKTLGLGVPETLLTRADEVIE